jgi:ribosome maturation protein Sdo1
MTISSDRESYINHVALKVSECIKLLQSDSNLPIQRARMRVRVTMPTADSKRLREKILEGAEKVEDEETGQEEWEVVRRLTCPRLTSSSLRFPLDYVD